jgi:hypothetical protein
LCAANLVRRSVGPVHSFANRGGKRRGSPATRTRYVSAERWDGFRGEIKGSDAVNAWK